MRTHSKSARPGWGVFSLTAVGAIALGGIGAVLLASYRSAALDSAASAEKILVTARAHVVAEELTSLVDEVARLSRLAELDLADGNLEPEKSVLRIARRDSGVLSVAIAILDERGDVLWAEPRDARPVTPGPSLVALARSTARAAIHAHEGEIAVAAPIAGRGAIVALVQGSRAVSLFGPELAAAIREGGSASIVSPGEAGRPDVTLAALRVDPYPEAPVGTGGAGQAWIRDAAGRRWLVSDATVGGGPLVLRLVQASRSVEGRLSAPFRRLVVAVAATAVLAILAGALLALVLRRLDRTELELTRQRDLAAMGKTAAAIAHEVKNSVNGLSVALDVLAAAKADPGVRRELHVQARHEVARLRDVADDLTFFAAPPRLAPVEVDVAGVCGRVALAVADAADAARVLVALAMPDRPLRIRGDPEKLVGALANLARNGIEAMATAPAGRERRLELTAREEGGAAVIEVSDRGPGIPGEVRARLFEPFVTTKRTGTGLGLAIAHRVIEAHGGRIQAVDREGGGTLFRVTLPALETSAERPRPATARTTAVA